jgi:cold shock protein
VKTFTRTQLRTVLEEFIEVDHARNEKILYDYIEYLETYQFKGETMTIQTRATGKVKWFNEQKGFGFITPDEGGAKADDIFVHYSSLSTGLKFLKEGQRVEFDVESGPKGLKAVDVVAL